MKDYELLDIPQAEENPDIRPEYWQMIGSAFDTYTKEDSPLSPMIGKSYTRDLQRRKLLELARDGSVTEFDV